MKNNGDSTVTFNDNSAIVATTDFSTKYIVMKRSPKLPFNKSNIIMWSWTEDKMISVPFNTIKNIKPLSDVLGNVRDG